MQYYAYNTHRFLVYTQNESFAMTMCGACKTGEKTFKNWYTLCKPRLCTTGIRHVMRDMRKTQKLTAVGAKATVAFCDPLGCKTPFSGLIQKQLLPSFCLEITPETDAVSSDEGSWHSKWGFSRRQLNGNSTFLEY